MKNAVIVSTAIFAGLLLGLSSHARAGDVAAGEAVFKQQCTACHSAAAGKNLIGPSLAGIVGRRSGSVEGFHYSNSNKAANVTWTESELDLYIMAPKTVVAGTTMTYPGLKDGTKRANLIAYLATLH